MRERSIRNRLKHGLPGGHKLGIRLGRRAQRLSDTDMLAPALQQRIRQVDKSVQQHAQLASAVIYVIV
ncbi:hypothetical protein VCV18_002454 [Metarhizium anisopliae]